MDYLLELQEISNTLDALYDRADKLYSTFKREQPDLDCMIENLAILAHDIGRATGFCNDVLPDMHDIDEDWGGTWGEELPDADDIIDGEFEDASIEGEG